MEKIKLGIAGTGKIVNELLPALKESADFTYSALFSRPHSEEKARALARKYSIEKVYTDYDDFIKDPALAFIYIALPNSVHFDYAQRALLAGKNVILEKPALTSAKEAKELIALAKEKGLYLFEAITTLHLPNFAIVEENLPKIGKLRLVQCNFSQYSSRYDAYLKGQVSPAFDPQRQGGALFDLGPYNLNLVCGLLGRPNDISYFANRGFNNVDTSGLAVLQYDGFLASCAVAKDSKSPCFAIFQGEKGEIIVHGAPNSLPKVEICLNGQRELMDNNGPVHRLEPEFYAFAQIYRQKNHKRQENLWQIMEIVSDCLEKARQNSL